MTRISSDVTISRKQGKDDIYGFIRNYEKETQHQKLYAGADSGREPDEDPSGRPSVRIREGKAPWEFIVVRDKETLAYLSGCRAGGVKMP